MVCSYIVSFFIYMSQAQKFGYERYVAVRAWRGKGNRLGTPAHAQASRHDSTAHVWRFFLPKWRSRQQWHHLMMSLMSFLHKLRVGIRGSMHKTQGSFVHSFHWVLQLVPQVVKQWRDRHSNSATLVPLKDWNYNQTGTCSLFVRLYMVEVILGILSWCALLTHKSAR